MRRVLVTGATGFIGRNCLALLSEKGHDVHAVARHRPTTMDLPHVSWQEVDLLRPGCATELVSRVRPDYLLHLAWYAVPGKFWQSSENIAWVRASLELLSGFAQNGGKRVVIAGSCAEYDWSGGECVEDTTPLVPNTLYGTCKHALERILNDWFQRTGLPSAWGRIFFLYGPHEHPSRLVAYVVRSLLLGQPALCSKGTQVRDFLHVADVASAFVTLLESEIQGPVNIGSGKPIAIRDVLMKIGQHLGRPDLLHLGARSSAGEPACLWANIQRLTEEVRWKPQYDLSRGIEQTIDWWRRSVGVAESAITPREER
jgi:nucleoside-diphosphate-sugar epimerase